MNPMFSLAIAILVGFLFLILIFFAIIAMFYKKIPQGEAIIRTGFGGTKVASDKGMYVVPVLHKVEVMDISVKKIEIERLQKDGLICKDNMRADIKVAFFVRVNKSKEAIIEVAQTIGCERASTLQTLNDLFEAKFSEGLKTVGKQFEFVSLYESRGEFRDAIINEIGRDLNGYTLEDCAIDYLEQTPIEYLSESNILDAEGIKKIHELTAQQNVKSNFIKREEEKTIRKQDVEAREAILELEKQLAEKEEAQRREISNIKAKEEAIITQVSEEERLKAESSRIATEEKIKVAEENMARQIIVAAKNKERTEAIEAERVEKDRLLEVTERERIVTLAQIEKEKVLEVEKKNIQDVIRDRVSLEKGVVEEQEQMKDIEAFKTAEREKKVAITIAEKEGQAALIKHIKMAEAEKEAAKQRAEEINIEAEAKKEAAVKEADARKIIAEAIAKEQATKGLSEAEVMHAKADAEERKGIVDAHIIEKKAMAEAEAIKAKADAEKLKGLVDAEIIKEQAVAEAQAIEEKAEAMKRLDGVGKDHEEFKLKLEKDLQVDLANINIQKEIADAQAVVISEALKAANIEILGGETMFFEQIMGQIAKGKGIDRMINHSANLQELKAGLSQNGDILGNIQQLIKKYNISTEDVKNLSIAKLIHTLGNKVDNDQDQESLSQIKQLANSFGLS